VLCTAIYGQVYHHEFLNFDDNEYVTENPHVNVGLSRDNALWAFTSLFTGNWHPVTWLSHMLVVQLFGLKPGAHSLVNVAFHAANSSLLLWVLMRMTGNFWRSWFIAAVFAVHPLHVESVAWISARKDVLSAFFGLLAILFYLGYVRRPSLGRYSLVFASLVLGLLAKPVLVTWPFVFLLLDYWPLQRLGPGRPSGGRRSLSTSSSSIFARVLEKLPLLGASLVFSGLALFSQRSTGAIVDFGRLPIGDRAGSALVAYCRYLLKTVWPSNLTVFNPHPNRGLGITLILAAGLLLLVVTVFVLRPKAQRFLIVGWLWYLGTLVPMIGFVQVGGQFIADRYMYLPIFGLLLAATWGFAPLLRKRPHQHLAVFSLVVVVGALAFASYRQVGFWKDSITLFSRNLEIAKDNYIGHYNLGNAYFQKGRHQRAIDHYQEAARIAPRFSRAYSALGYTYAVEKRYQEALIALERAVELNERDLLSLTTLGFVLVAAGSYDRATAVYERALVLDPAHLDALLGIGYASEMKGHPEVAERHYSSAVQRNPGSAAARFRQASLHARHGRTQEAISEYLIVLNINPTLFEAQNNIANAYARLGRYDDAVRHYREALKLSPADREVRMNLERAEASLRPRQPGSGH
jgi:tetratricopeptide (TPR) repeat protein